MSAEPIRTWILRYASDGALCAWEQALSPSLDHIEVIELEPVLDLLERMTEALKVKADPGRGASPVVELTQLRHDVLVATDLLREHGRLP